MSCNVLKYSRYIKLIILIFLSVSVFAEDGNKETHSEHKEKKFAPGEFIMGHIGDSYDWHLFDFHGHAVSIPLPVILYSKHQGLQIFISSKLKHGHTIYKGFKWEKEGVNKNKIVEVMADGSIELPYNFSLTKNACSILFSVSVLLLIFIKVASAYKKAPGQAPKGLQNAMEALILFVRDGIAKPSIGPKYEKFLPYLLTVFFFIWFNNILGLIPIIPGGANVTGNINVTMILALFTFFITALNGNVHYWKEFVNAPGVPWWLKFPFPLMPIIEIMGMFIKPFVLMVRLFANITAGHIIALGFFSLIFIFGAINPAAGLGTSVLSILFVLFMTVLELLVAFIQAYVFTLLSAIFFGIAVTEHHVEAKHGH